MRKSLFRKLAAILYGLFVCLFSWMIYAQPEEWWKGALFFLAFTPVYFLSIRIRCEYYDRLGAFAPELESDAGSKTQGDKA